MNPCVVIATHDRLQITTVNIKLLVAQAVEIVIVVSDEKEADYYYMFPVHVVYHKNNPLGAKWQAGIDYARTLDPSHIVITGSDDLLSIGFFERWCGQLDFTGFDHWYIWNDNKLYLLQYRAKQPLGGGRIYSRALLEKMNYKLFDITKNKLLDDYGWNNIGKVGCIAMNPEILAIKGNWPVMNKVDLNHRNVKLRATYEGDEARKIMKERFNYEP